MIRRVGVGIAAALGLAIAFAVVVGVFGAGIVWSFELSRWVERQTGSVALGVITMISGVAFIYFFLLGLSTIGRWFREDDR